MTMRLLANPSSGLWNWREKRSPKADDAVSAEKANIVGRHSISLEEMARAGVEFKFICNETKIRNTTNEKW